jgi:putative transposase
MSTQRKTYTADFKAKAAVEVLKGQRLMNEIASDLAVHPVLLGQWKKQLVEDAAKIFTSPHQRKEADAEALQARLYQEIGQLKVELDWLKKKCGRTR